MLSIITAALGFLGKLPGTALSLADRSKRWGQEDRAEIDATFKAEIDSLNTELAAAADDQEISALRLEIKRVRQEERTFYRARRELLLSKSLVERMAPEAAFTLERPQLPAPERQVLANAAFVIARLEPPKTVEEHLRQGNAFYTAGDFHKALDQYNRALGLQPADPAALNNRATTLRHLGLYDEALADLDRSLQLRPHDPSALYLRGVVLQRMRRYDEALADYSRAQDLAPHDPSPTYNRACCLSLMGRLAEAVENLKETISRDKIYRTLARKEEDFDNVRLDPTLGPDFQRLVAESDA